MTPSDSAEICLLSCVIAAHRGRLMPWCVQWMPDGVDPLPAAWAACDSPFPLAMLQREISSDAFLLALLAMAHVAVGADRAVEPSSLKILQHVERLRAAGVAPSPSDGTVAMQLYHRAEYIHGSHPAPSACFYAARAWIYDSERDVREACDHAAIALAFVDTRVIAPRHKIVEGSPSHYRVLADSIRGVVPAPSVATLLDARRR